MKKLLLILALFPVFVSGQFYSSRVPDIGDRIPSIDVSTNAQIAMDYEHHEVHDGRHYTFTDFDADIDITDTMTYIITTADSTRWAHFIFIVDGQLQTEVSLYENTTHNTGAVQTSYNNDRNSANIAITTINLTAGGGADGTEIFKDHFGIDAGGGVNRITGGGGTRGENEWILKQDTKYLFRITSFTDNNIVSVKFTWYEHINR